MLFINLMKKNHVELVFSTANGLVKGLEDITDFTVSTEIFIFT